MASGSPMELDDRTLPEARTVRHMGVFAQKLGTGTSTPLTSRPRQANAAPVFLHAPASRRE